MSLKGSYAALVVGPDPRSLTEVPLAITPGLQVSEVKNKGHRVFEVFLESAWAGNEHAQHQ